MKSERRHELQHNDLAEYILKGYQTVVPYKNSILGVGLLLVALVIGVSFYMSHRASVEGAAWGSLGVPVFQPDFRTDQTLSVTLNLMQKTVVEYPRTTAAEWAKVFQGDSALMLGVNQILTDKKAGVENLAKAKELYEEALQAPIIAPAKERAMFGRARALESLIQNKSQLDDAITAYKDLNASFPHGMFEAIANKRIEQLGGSDALAFYTALSKYAPKPKATSKLEAPQNPLKELGPLPENPPAEPAPPKGSASPAGAAPGVPAPSANPLEPGKTAAPKTQTPKAESSKTEAPKTEAPKTESPKTEVPKTESPKTEAPKTESPKTEAPKTEAPKPQTPKAAPPKPEPATPQPAAPEAKKLPPLSPDVPSPEPPKPEAPKKDK